MIVYKNFLLCILLFVSVHGNTQIPAFIHYESGNGLPSNELYNLKQDRKGFLWIGSDAGLIRYDGFRFLLFTNKRQRGASVTDILEDSKGTIWCHNFSGQVLYISGDSLKIFEQWDPFYRKQLIEATLDSLDNLYITNYKNHIYKFDIRNGKTEKLLSEQVAKQSVTTLHNGTIAFTEVDSGRVVLFKKNRAVSLPIQSDYGKQFNHTILNTVVFFVSAKQKQTLAFQRQNPLDKSPSLFYYQSDTLFTHAATAILRKLNLYPISVYDDDQGNLFIGTYKGCLWLQKTKNGWILKKQLFLNTAVSSICKDREGNIWVGTLKNGLFQIPNLNNMVFKDEELGVEGNNLSLMASDGKNKLYVSTSTKSLLEIDTRYNKVTANINALYERDAQAFKYNNYNGHLLLYKTHFTVIDDKKKLESDPQLISAPKDFSIRKDGLVFSAGVHLQASFKKAQHKKQDIINEFGSVDESSLGPISHKNENWDRVIISDQRCRCVLYDEINETLWVGFSASTVCYKNKQPVTLVDNEIKQPVIATHFQQLNDGTICIGTIEQGVYFVQSGKITAHYTIANGLSSNRIKRLKAAGNYLWLVTSESVQGLNTVTKEIMNIGKQNGLLSKEVFDIDVLNNYVYLSTSKGLQFFPVNINTQNKVAPLVYIKHLKTADSLYTGFSNPTIAYSAANITIELEGVSLKSQGQYSFEYRMKGLDSNWISVPASNNIVRYPSLQPGSFIFEARVKNEDGIYSSTKQLSFAVKKPWWLQWWFIAFVFFLIAALFYLLVNRRISRLRKINKEEIEKVKTLEQLRNSQLSALKAQMNPHFMFNALNSIQEFIVLNDKKQANMFMGKFADLMRATLDLSNKETISFDEELKILNLYLELEALRFEDNFQYHITINEQVGLNDINIPSMLIQPYVENAVKHGLLHQTGKKILQIDFALSDRVLICTIQDNGIGRKRSQEINNLRKKKYTSFGTGATQQRLELLNYGRTSAIAVVYEDLYDAMGNAKGTKVVLQIPV